MLDFEPTGQSPFLPSLHLASIHSIQWDSPIGLVEMIVEVVSLRRSSLR
jgi:hypothetical protein